MPQPAFWKSFHSELMSHTGEYISREVKKVIEEVIVKCGKLVIGSVADNASNKKKVRNLLQEEYSEIACHDCAAHSLDIW